MKRFSAPIWLVPILLAWLAAAPLAACGPWGIDVFFWPPHEPGPPRESFLQGQLGILDTALDPAYHYVAYRHLAALETGSENLEALRSLWPPRTTAGGTNPVTAWRTARAKVPGIEPPGRFSRSRHVSTEDGNNYVHNYFLNCLDDALLTAAQTLEARVERFGPASKEVRAWLSAQDDVFANCGGGESIPIPLDEGWDPLIRADRAYQIAAAHFYAARYEEAAARFREIARDRESPWHQLSAYLVARALIRDGRHADAGRELRAVLADPELAAIHLPAKRLLAYAVLRSDPEDRHRELTERLLATRLKTPPQQDFIDYQWLLWRRASDDDLGSWLIAMAGSAVYGELAWQAAAKQWRREARPAWLIAALVNADAVTAESDPAGSEPLLAAAVDVDSAGYLTAVYHRSRLLIGLGRAGEARAVIDSVLDRPDELSAADFNRLRLLRAEVTPDLDAYLRLVTLVPAGLGWDDGGGDLIPMSGPGRAGGAQAPYFPYYRHGDPILPDSAIELLNHGLTTEELLETVQADLLPEPWRRRLALAVWTRAAITDNSAVALEVAPLASTLAPELTAAMDAFAAADAGDRRFDAAWTMLRFPGLSPVLRWNVGRRTPIDEIDELRDNGWCDGALQADALPKQIVRSPEQLAAVQATLSTSVRGHAPGATPAWPELVGRIVLSRAETHPDEPRLAEALHRIVRATRIGCPTGGYGEVSRTAFQLLHRRFPSSPWAEKTPHWFD